MLEYKKPSFDGSYGIREQKGKDVLYLLKDPFSISPMRAALSEGGLNKGRKDMLKSVLDISLERDLGSLIVGVYAGRRFKEDLDPYGERALEVTETLHEFATSGREKVKDLGYVPEAKLDKPEDVNSWPGLFMAVYDLKMDGKLKIRIIPYARFHKPPENPLLPMETVRERGVVITGRKENYDKWKRLGYEVELAGGLEKP